MARHEVGPNRSKTAAIQRKAAQRQPSKVRQGRRLAQVLPPWIAASPKGATGGTNNPCNSANSGSASRRSITARSPSLWVWRTAVALSGTTSADLPTLRTRATHPFSYPSSPSASRLLIHPEIFPYLQLFTTRCSYELRAACRVHLQFSIQEQDRQGKVLLGQERLKDRKRNVCH